MKSIKKAVSPLFEYSWLFFPQSLAVLRAELVGAVGALQRCVGVLPEALGMQKDADLPDDDDRDGNEQETRRIEAPQEQERREHHQMIPVEDAAGGTAAVAHHQAERAPDQHADQIADVEEDGDDEEHAVVDNSGMVYHADSCGEQCPDDHDAVRSACGGNDIRFQMFGIELLANGTEALPEELERTDGDVPADGDKLKEHVDHPHAPQKMQDGKALKECKAAEQFKLLRAIQIHQNGQNQNDASGSEPEKVDFSDSGHGMKDGHRINVPLMCIDES